jgi:CCR4-NOT transcription complex subunit 4
MQKNIVYVINLSPQIAREEVLVRFEYFGQYGKIVSVTINNEHAYNSDQGQCYSAYITYSQPHEAALAILALDQSVRENRLMRASFGRTKYCKYFLKQAQCQNRECPYMHEMCLNQAELVN